MINKAAFIEQLTTNATRLLSGEKSQLHKEFEHNFRALLQSTLGKLELVNREEFDAQVAVLRRTRERMEQLEETVTRLEQKLEKTPTESTEEK
ncbi:accessory factor UbiK family protein [Spongorhabdus nitratireducens]